MLSCTLTRRFFFLPLKIWFFFLSNFVGMSYKYCMVPCCTNTTHTSPDKIFFYLPRDPVKRRAWITAMRRDDSHCKISDKTSHYCCEDHFNLPTDMLNYMEYKVMGSIKRILVSDDCLPSKFECQSGSKGTLLKTRTSQHAAVNKLKLSLRRQRERIGDESKVHEEIEEQTVIDSEGKPSNDPSHPDYVPSIFPFNTTVKKEKSEEKLSRSQRLGKKRLLAEGSTSKHGLVAVSYGKGESILKRSKDGVDPPKYPMGRRKRMIDDGSSSSGEQQQRQIANETSLPDATEGESSSSIKKEELEASSSSQPDPAPSVADEPPPKVAKIAQPKVNKVPAASLIVDGPRQRKPTQPFSPVAKAWLEVGKTKPKYADYVFEGKRLVNMGYFIKSLQTLNDHDGRKCSFSDMRVCGETKDGWNVGVMLTCKLCPTTKVIWMEDPDTEQAPQIPIIFKPNFTVLQPTQTSPLVQAPSATICKSYPVQGKLPIRAPAPKQKRARQPYRSKRKTPTPPPDDDTPAEHFLQQHASTEVTIPMRKPKYPNTLLVRPNTTLRYGPPQTTPFTGQLLVRPVIGQQVPTIAQSQRSIINQSPVPIVGQSSVLVVDQSLVPTADFPPITSIKQEVILPDDGTNPAFINSPSRVEMTFCVDQDENAASGSVPSDKAVDATGDIATTPDGHTLTSLQSPSGQLSSSTAMDVNMACDTTPTDTLPVDLNLVKKEVDDETLDH